MQVRTIRSRPELKHNVDRIALQYGPMVYCVEGVDNRQRGWNFIVPENTEFVVAYEPRLLGGVNTISFNGTTVTGSADGKQLETRNIPLKAIPYFSWNNRGSSEMQVWLPTAFREFKINPY